MAKAPRAEQADALRSGDRADAVQRRRGRSGAGAKAIDALCVAVAEAVAEGATLVLLSDRGVDREHAPIPSLLATAAVHHYLIRRARAPSAGWSSRPARPARPTTSAC